jgi:hypothetical protein
MLPHITAAMVMVHMESGNGMEVAQQLRASIEGADGGSCVAGAYQEQLVIPGCS